METTLTIIRRIEDLGSVQREWDQLASVCGKPELRFDDLRMLFNSSGPRVQPWVVLLRVEGQPAALCPWVIRERVLPFPNKVLTWLGRQSRSHAMRTILIDDRYRATVKRKLIELMQDNPEFDRFDFPGLRRGSFASEVAKALGNPITEKESGGTERIQGAQMVLRAQLWRHLYRVRRRLLAAPARARAAWKTQAEHVIFAARLRDLDVPHSQSESEVRLLTPSDLPAIETAFGSEKAGDLARRMRDSWIVGAWDGSELVGYGCATDRPRAQEGAFPFLYKVIPPPATIYFFDLYVRADCRSRGIGSRIRSFEIQEAVRRGYTYVFLIHGSGNHSAINLSTRFGLREIGRVTYLRRGIVKRINLDALHRIGARAFV